MKENCDDIYKQLAVQTMDEALVKACHVKVAHPEALGDILLQLAQYYMKHQHNDEILI